MQFATFNIRCDYDWDGMNGVRYRKPLNLQMIAHEQPDVLCFQAALPQMTAWRKKNPYDTAGCGDGAKLDDKQMTTAYRRERAFLQCPGYANATEGGGRTPHAFMLRKAAVQIDDIGLYGPVRCAGFGKMADHNGQNGLSGHDPVYAAREGAWA